MRLYCSALHTGQRNPVLKNFQNVIPVCSLDFSVSGAIETVQLAIPAKPKHDMRHWIDI